MTTQPALIKSLLRQFSILDHYEDWQVREATNAVNRAFQVLWTDPSPERREHYTRDSYEFFTLPEQTAYEMPSWIQAVLSPVVFTDNPKKQLTPLRDISEIHHFTTLLPPCNPDQPVIRPNVYYHDRAGAHGAKGSEGTVSTLHLAPAPPLAEKVTMRVERECPRLKPVDICPQGGDPVSLPIPHQYIESLLFPIARYFMLDFDWFSSNATEAKIAVYKDEYERSLQRIGLTNPDKSS